MPCAARSFLACSLIAIGSVLVSMTICPGGRARSVHRLERIFKDQVRHPTTLGDAFALVESPMNAEIDPALAVLLLGFGQRLEPPRHQWSNVSLAVDGHAVELVGDEPERNV